MLLFVLAALLESLLGLITMPFKYAHPSKQVSMFFQKTALNEGLHNTLKTLLISYTPSPWAPGPYSQTLFGNVTPKERHTYTRRDFILLNDGVFTSIFWKEPQGGCMTHRHIVLICPGLGGNHQSCSAVAISDLVADMGMRAIVYNRRGHDIGCSLVPLPDAHMVLGPPTRHKPYPLHCDTDDMHTVVQYIQKKHPQTPMIVIGVSAGANLAVKYIAQHLGEHPFVGVVSLANGSDLVNLTKAFDKRPHANTLMVGILKELFEYRKQELLIICRHNNKELDTGVIQRSRTVRDFETNLILPLYRDFYKDIDEYYRQHSSHEAYRQVDIPLLSLGSMDDPLIDPSLHDHVVNASKTNDNIYAVLTREGGHMGWLTGWHGEQLHLKVIREFISYIRKS